MDREIMILVRSSIRLMYTDEFIRRPLYKVLLCTVVTEISSPHCDPGPVPQSAANGAGQNILKAVHVQGLTYSI